MKTAAVGRGAWAVLCVAGLCLSAGAVLPLGAQTPGTQSEGTSEQVLRERYAHAARIQGAFARPLILNRSVSPNWINGTDVFWYERETAQGKRFMRVDVAQGTRGEAFDHASLASALAQAAGKQVAADVLPLSNLSFSRDLAHIEFEAFKQRWRYVTATSALTPLGDVPAVALLVSPDGRQGAFLRDRNIWLRDLQSGAERALTTDGERFYAYGAETDAFGNPIGKPQALWSPDSRTLLTARLDERQVGELPMVEFAPKDGSLLPKAYAHRVALPGDAHVPMFEMMAIDTRTGRIVRAQHPPIPTVRMNDTPFKSHLAAFVDARRAYFVDLSRDERTAVLVEFDTASGATRPVFEERSDDGFLLKLSPSLFQPVPLIFPGNDELVWHSERSGTGQLYLYDLKTGQLKRQLTQGDAPVRDIIGLAGTSRRLVYARGSTRKGGNPYQRELAVVDLDTGHSQLIEQRDADSAVKLDMPWALRSAADGTSIHSAGISPSGRYLVRTAGRVDGLADTDVIDLTGQTVLALERADATALSTGWRWPEPVELTAADGTTPIAGLLFRPSFQRQGERYPVIDYIYGGPQMTNVPQTMEGKAYLEAASLAELGFVVVIIDGRGTPGRSRAFHRHVSRQIDHASELEDHVAGIRQLAARHPYMDLARVGIYGFSGGGYMTTMAMLRFPDFFQVGVAGAANTDQRVFWHSWGERYHGLLEGDNYVQQALMTHADRLQGKLLIIHGLNDFWVHPAGIFQLMQAFQNAHKDFDTVLMPQEGHALTGYAQRRMWAYFLQHLRGETLPAGLHHQSQQELGSVRLATQLSQTHR